MVRQGGVARHDKCEGKESLDRMDADKQKDH